MTDGLARPESALAALREAWGRAPPRQDELYFLTLSLDRRREALARIKTLQEISRRPRRPTRAEQEVIASELGIGLKRLQELMREWTQGPSVLKAAPHAVAAGRRQRTFPAKEILEGIIRKALAKNPWVSEPHVSRRVTRICHRLGIQPPARMTVRRALEIARATTLHPGRYIDESIAPETTASVPGGTLLLTREYFNAGIIMADGGAGHASARFLVDMASLFVVGASSSGSLSDLAREAHDTLTEGWFSIGHWHRPETLVIATDLSPQEEATVLTAAERTNVKVEYALRRRARQMTRIILHRGFEHLHVVPPPTRRSGPEPDWPHVTSEEFDHLLRIAVETNRRERAQSIDQEPRMHEALGWPGGGEELAAALTELFGNK